LKKKYKLKISPGKVSMIIIGEEEIVEVEKEGETDIEYPRKAHA
jgi:hypothetical protein